MPSILIIGYGNSIRGDDAVGWRAGCELAEADLPAGVEVVAAPQLSPEMSPDLARADAVIFIDAACQGAPGEVRCCRLEPRSIPLGEMPHALKPADLLGLSAQLYGESPRCFLITLTGASFEFGDKLSPAVASALPRLLERVRELAAREMSSG